MDSVYPDPQNPSPTEKFLDGFSIISGSSLARVRGGMPPFVPYPGDATA